MCVCVEQGRAQDLVRCSRSRRRAAGGRHEERGSGALRLSAGPPASAGHADEPQRPNGAWRPGTIGPLVLNNPTI